MEAGGTPVVFVHGLWLHADSWGAWVDAFDESGYSARAVGWPGDAPTVAETRADPKRVAGHGIADVVAHHAHEIGKLDRKPIVVGHSFGGLIAQRLLSGGFASAAVAIDPAPAKGVLFLPASALRVASIALRNPGNRNGAVSLTKEQFRYGFGNALSQEESGRGCSGAVDDPIAGQTALRGGAGEPRAALARGRRPQERDAWAAANHGRRKGPHGSRGGQPADAEALPQVVGHHRSADLRRPGPFADDRQWLA